MKRSVWSRLFSSKRKEKKAAAAAAAAEAATKETAAEPEEPCCQPVSLTVSPFVHPKLQQEEKFPSYHSLPKHIDEEEKVESVGEIELKEEKSQTVASAAAESEQLRDKKERIEKPSTVCGEDNLSSNPQSEYMTEEIDSFSGSSVKVLNKLEQAAPIPIVNAYHQNRTINTSDEEKVIEIKPGSKTDCTLDLNKNNADKTQMQDFLRRNLQKSCYNIIIQHAGGNDAETFGFQVVGGQEGAEAEAETVRISEVKDESTILDELLLEAPADGSSLETEDASSTSSESPPTIEDPSEGDNPHER